MIHSETTERVRPVRRLTPLESEVYTSVDRAGVVVVARLDNIAPPDLAAFVGPGGAYIAHLAMSATLKNRKPGTTHCVRHPELLCPVG